MTTIFHEDDDHYYDDYTIEDFVEDDEEESNPTESDESSDDSYRSNSSDTSQQSIDTDDDDESSDSEDDSSDDDEESSDQESSDDEEPEVRRSGRQRRRVDKLDPDPTKKSYFNCTPEEKAQLEQAHNIFGYREENPSDEMESMDLEYDTDRAPVWAMFMKRLCDMFGEHGYAFGQQFILEKGLKVFGERGQEAAKQEMDQLYKRNCFTPVNVKEMTKSERKKAQRALLFLTEKRDGSCKGRTVYDGSRTREWLNKEDTASPTAAIESILLTGVIDAHEGRDVMTANVANAFIQTELPKAQIEGSDGEERIFMKIQGKLVDLMMDLDPQLYGPHIVYENGQKVVYVQILRAIYGMLVSAMLWYEKFRGELESELGFKFNPYDGCVANRMVNGKQHTIRFHVDDLMSSHMDPAVNDRFLIWLNKMYGAIKETNGVRGKVHDYLGMTLDFRQEGVMKVDMTDYVEKMLKEFPVDLGDQSAPSPAAENLLDKGKGKLLEGKRKEAFHKTVAQGLFLCKRARPDIQTAIAVLCTRVLSPNESDWRKLLRLMKYLNGTKKLVLTLGADNLSVVKWYVDASFAVHPDFKSHTGSVMTLGRGGIQSMSRKQKLNTRSSTEAELVGCDDAITMLLWTQLFLEAQGYHTKNLLYQDNKSTILLGNNGQASAGKRSRAINVRYFFLTDQVEKGLVKIVYCSTDKMLADIHTKPLQGQKFIDFRDQLLGITKLDFPTEA